MFCEYQTIEDIDKAERPKNIAQRSVSFSPSPNINRNHGGEVQGNHEDGESSHNVVSSTETGEIAE